MNRCFEINEDGCNVRCKLYAQSMTGIKRAVIACQGFAGHKDSGATAHFADRVTSKYKDVAVVTFNWPCHGDDVKKKLTLNDCMTYLALVAGYVQNRLGAQTLYAYSVSFGGWLTLKYISERGNPFKKIALRCPAIPMYDTLTGSVMTDDDRGRLARGREILVGFDRKVPVSPAFLNELRESDIAGRDFLDFADDLLIIQGTKDEIVPFEAVRAFAEANVIEFVAVEDADHRFQNPLKMDAAVKAVLDFFQF